MTVIPAPERLEPIEQPAPAPLGHRRPLLDPAWPLVVMTVWMPVAYFLGFSAVVWIIPAFVFGIPMIMRRTLRVPGHDPAVRRARRLDPDLGDPARRTSTRCACSATGS